MAILRFVSGLPTLPTPFQAGADTTVPDHLGFTPIQRARGVGKRQCVAMLEVSFRVEKRRMRGQLLVLHLAWRSIPETADSADPLT